MKNEKGKRKNERRGGGGNAERLIIRPPHIPAGGLIGNRIPARGFASARGFAPGYHPAALQAALGAINPGCRLGGR